MDRVERIVHQLRLRADESDQTGSDASITPGELRAVADYISSTESLLDSYAEHEKRIRKSTLLEKWMFGSIAVFFGIQVGWTIVSWLFGAR